MGPRIAIVCEWFLPRFGGIELHLRDLAVHLRQAGADIEVVTPVPGPPEVDGIAVRRLCERGKENGGYVFAPPLQGNNWRDFLFLANCFLAPGGVSVFSRLREILQSGAYDVVHVHFGTPFAFAALREAVKQKIPAVATFHSVAGFWETPLARSLAAVSGAAHWPVRYSAVSGKVARSFRPILGDVPIEVLGNGIDAEWWGEGRGQDRLKAEEGNPVQFVSVMRLHRRKRPQALLKAFARARAGAPGAAMKLKIIGDGPERGAMEAMIARLQLGSDVELCGRIEREAIRAELLQSDLFVLPSRLESFGIAALEARSAGVPVLGMRDAGLRDFLQEGQDCLLAGSDEEFAALLVCYCREPDLRERLVRGCRMAPAGLSWPEVTGRHLALYDHVAGK